MQTARLVKPAVPSAPRKPAALKVTLGARLYGTLMHVVEGPPDYAGSFVIPNWELSRQRRIQFPRRKQLDLAWMHVPDVYTAYRQTEHVLRGYGVKPNEGETALIDEALKLARELNLAALGASTGHSAERVRQDLESRIQRLSLPFRLSRNETKTEVRKQLGSMLTEENPGGSLNLPAIRARSVKTGSLLRQRADEIHAIDPRIFARQRVLLTLIQLANLRITAAKDFVDRLHDTERPIHTMSQISRRRIADQCEFLAREIEQLDYRPYYTMCRFTARDLRLMRQTLVLEQLGPSQTTFTRKALSHCRVAIDIKSEQVKLERLILIISRDGKLDTAGRTWCATALRQLVWRITHISDFDLEVPVIKNATYHLTQALDYVSELPGPRSQALILAALKAASREL